MSYFKEIASRARPTSQGRSQNIPLLNPTRSLFRPIALVQPLESPDESVDSDEAWMTGSPQTATIDATAQAISRPAPVASPDLSSHVPSPTHLPATTPAPVIPPPTTPVIGSRLPPRERSQPAPLAVSPAPPAASGRVLSYAPGSATTPFPKQGQVTQSSNPAPPGRSLPIPLSASPSPLSSPQMPAASSSTPDLHRDSPQHLVPITPTQYSEADQKPTGRTPIPPGHQATVNSVSASNLTTEIAKPLRATLKPKHSTQVLPTERMAESFSQLPSPPSLPGSSKPDRSQRSTIHIGVIDIQITPPPVIPQPQPLTTRSVVAATTGSLSRGFASGFGLRQG